MCSPETLVDSVKITFDVLRSTLHLHLFFHSLCLNHLDAVMCPCDLDVKTLRVKVCSKKKIHYSFLVIVGANTSLSRLSLD